MTGAKQRYPISGTTRLFSIVGSPITQVKTPQLMNALFDVGGIDAVCLPFEVPTTDFEIILAGIKKLANLDGLVITVPHKVRAMTMADEVSESAKGIGAINVMRRQLDGTWSGDMLDGSGLVLGLRRLGFKLRGQRVKQLGAGGAGAAVAFALANAGAAHIEISDPRYESSKQLALRLGRFHPGFPVRIDPNPVDVSHTDLLINCSPIGMNPGDDMPVSFGAFPASLQVVDIIMTPAETPLLKHARQYGCKTTNGRPMIEGQFAAMAEFFDIPIPASFVCFSERHTQS